MTYRIEIKHSARKEIDRLPSAYQCRIHSAIERLRTDPFPHGYRKIEAEEIAYRIRVGPYRVVYQIEHEKLIITVVRAGHRKKVYRGI